jgi:ribosomal protein L37AE/L43A
MSIQWVIPKVKCVNCKYPTHLNRVRWIGKWVCKKCFYLIASGLNA